MPSVFNSLSIKSAYGYRYACLMNGATADEPQDWREWNAKWRKVIVAQSGFEWNFATKVIQIVPGLKPSQVTPQRSFIGNDGRERHMDFGIEVGNRRIAVEVEGWDKTGEDRGKNKSEHDEFNRRIQSLTADGWEVMTVTNAQFMNDPGFYAAQIRQLLLPASSTDDSTPSAPNPAKGATTNEEKAAATAEEKVAATPLEETAVKPSKQGHGLYWVIGLVVGAIALILILLFGIFNRIGEVSDAPPSTPETSTELTNPGNAKDCSDFATQTQAQAWFDKYFAQFGDVANLDGDKDGRVCVSLP